MVFGCKFEERKDNQKQFKNGDIVYLKPDSIKAIIVYDKPFFLDYRVAYNDSLNVRHNIEINEWEIYK